MTPTSFAKGARVKLSEEGRKASARASLRNRLGTVTGRCRDGMGYLVLWDGVENPQPWHVDYLEPADPLTPAPPPA